MDMLAKTIAKPKSKCRNIHTSIRDHSAITKYCEYCSSKTGKKVYVEITDDNNCMCCGSKLPQPENYKTLRKIMNKFADQYGALAEIFPYHVDRPDEGKIIVRVKHGWFWYETDIKFVGLFIEMGKLDRIPFPAPTELEFKTSKTGKKKLKTLKWTWEIGDELSTKEAIKIQKFQEKYDRYNTVMKLINSKVVMLT